MDKQQIIAKYAKKFANKPNSKRPVLEGIHYGHNGVAFVTNAEYALRLKNAHSYPEPITVHAASSAPIDGIYPAFDKIFPASFDNEIPISRKDIEQTNVRVRCATNIASIINKKRPIVVLEAENGAAYLKIHNGDHQLTFSAFFGHTQKAEQSKRALNAEYLHTALSVFADAESSLVVLKLKDPLSPILLTDEKDIDVLIMPIRVAT